MAVHVSEHPSGPLAKRTEHASELVAPPSTLGGHLKHRISFYVPATRQKVEEATTRQLCTPLHEPIRSTTALIAVSQQKTVPRRMFRDTTTHISPHRTSSPSECPVKFSQWLSNESWGSRSSTEISSVTSCRFSFLLEWTGTGTTRRRINARIWRCHRQTCG